MSGSALISVRRFAANLLGRGDALAPGIIPGLLQRPAWLRAQNQGPFFVDRTKEIGPASFRRRSHYAPRSTRRANWFHRSSNPEHKAGSSGDFRMRQREPAFSRYSSTNFSKAQYELSTHARARS